MRALLFTLLFFISSAASATNQCTTRLWPSSIRYDGLSVPLKVQLFSEADRLRSRPPMPLAALASAGIVNPSDPQLIASRAALGDAMRVALLATAYRVRHDALDLRATREILTAWSTTYIPTGHPVDESRLDLMIWAYDLVRCELSNDDRSKIDPWLRKILEKKGTWPFGASSIRNNQHTHQLKLQVLISLILGENEKAKSLIAEARAHALANIGDPNGMSYDYKERDALHYHVFNLEAWDEIELVTHCCTALVTAAGNFAWNKIQSGDVFHQFAASEISIDKKRAAAGHAYAADHYDESRAARAALVSTTGKCGMPHPYVAKVLAKASSDTHLLFFAVRRELWNTSLGC